jgi:hypothetical protein
MLSLRREANGHLLCEIQSQEQEDTTGKVKKSLPERALPKVSPASSAGPLAKAFPSLLPLAELMVKKEQGQKSQGCLHTVWSSKGCP